MTQSIVQLIAFFLLLAGVSWPLGAYLARVFDGRGVGLDRVLGPVERLLLRSVGATREREDGWRTYARDVVVFTAVSFLVTYLVQRSQGWLPLNPQSLPAVGPDLAFNTAISFATNTNWQSYGGETTMSSFTQMLALGVQNFASAAAGLAVLAAVTRGLARKEAQTIGCFWTDLVRGTLYVLLPLSFLLAIALVGQGVVQSFLPAATASLADGASQLIPRGPVASQIAIKQLGTNGGGFFNVNSAHPLENPTAFSNLLQTLAILVLPAAQCVAYGRWVRDPRQGRAILAAMTAVLVAMLIVCTVCEQRGNPALAPLGIDQTASAIQPGGNMEGKEARFGIASSALWATVTTAASNGSVNSMHDSYTPLGGLVPMWLMQLGEVIFGGVGSGLYGMLMFVVVAVFIAGLMVGRTPEYLGKKIEPFEMKMAAIAILVPCGLVLVGTAIAVAVPTFAAAAGNPGPHGFSQVLYAFSSASNNNGSAFAGLSANVPFYNIALGVCMLFGRLWVMVPVLAFAGSMAAKKRSPTSLGTMPTHTPLFVVMLVAVVLVVGALTFVPALALGPIAEELVR